jgi:hypothetical protein
MEFAMPWVFGVGRFRFFQGLSEQVKGCSGCGVSPCDSPTCESSFLQLIVGRLWSHGPGGLGFRFLRFADAACRPRRFY